MEPADPVTVASFMRDCLERPRPLARSTINSSVLSAIADLYRYKGVSPTHDPLVDQAKKVVVRLTKPPQPKLPLTIPMLVAMARAAVPAESSIRDVFMFVLMFLGFLREDEVTSLMFPDIWVGMMEGVVEEVLFIRVRKSKTDPGRNGCTVVLVSCAHSVLCPVRWFRLHCRVRRSRTHVFHAVGPDALPLARSTPNSLLKKWLGVIGVDPKLYGSHSLRRGGATAAAALAVRVHILKRHGRWASDAVYLYIQDPNEARLEVSRALLGVPVE